jgi:hypothetical protein
MGRIAILGHFEYEKKYEHSGAPKSPPVLF